jgi:predicted alpha/beta superfamily hydrolase
MRTAITFLILMTVSPMLSAQSKPGTKATTKPFSLGIIDELHSNILGEIRGMNIYLPEGYDPNDTLKYPVIYLLDGGEDEDFIHVVGIVQFNNFPWIDRVPKSILVGIINVDRQKDFSFPTTIKDDKEAWPATGGSEKFIAFIEKELQPYVEKTYHANKERTLIGQSFGGLLATEILLKKPTLFAKYIIISPSLWWDDGSLLNAPSVIFDEHFQQSTSIYIGVGKEGLTPGARTHVMEVDANLLAERLGTAKSKHVNVYLDYLPEEDHATIGHQAVFNAFRALYPAPEKE